MTLPATGGRDARLDGTTNVCELLINTVNRKKPKLLLGFNQKVCSQLCLLHLGIR